MAGELARLKERAGQATVADLREGSWLLPFVRHCLDEYAATDAAALHAAHPGRTGEALVQARIGWAQRRALVAGGASASMYASVVMASMAAGGIAGIVGLPTAVAAFALDLYFTAQTQIRLGWDLATLYGHDIDPADDDHLLELAQITFGFDAHAGWRPIRKGFLPVASRFGSRVASVVGRVGRAAAMRALGRKLVQRGLARFAIPGLGVPMCAGVNYVTTGRIGATAERAAQTLAAEASAAPALVLEALLWIAAADGRLRGVEVRLVDDLAELWDDKEASAALADRNDAEWLAALKVAPKALRATIYRAAVEAAALDGSLHTEENARLKQLAEACGVRFDPRVVSAAVVANA